MRRSKQLLKSKLAALEHFPTIAEILSWAVIINEEVFKGAIDTAGFSIEILPFRSNTWAEVVPNDHLEDVAPLLRMAYKYPNEEIYLNTLAHEMIHIWQLQTGQPWGHGDSFWKWKRRFKSHGLVLMLKYGQHGEVLARRKADDLWRKRRREEARKQ